MGKKRRIFIAILGLAVLGGFAWMIFSPRVEPEPVYLGKPLSKWLEVYDSGNTNRPFQQLDDTQTAIRSMGTNAIPTMLRMLRTPDLPWKNSLFALARKQHVIKINYVEPWKLYERAAMGLEVLGPRAVGAVPELMTIFDQNPSPEAKSSIARVVGLIGPEAKAAVPSLLRGAASSNSNVRGNSIYALGRIQAEPKLVVPLLINALQDPAPIIRWNAAVWLKDFGTNSKAAVPALVKLIESKDPPTTNIFGSIFVTTPHIKAAALNSLRLIDPEAAAKVSTNVAEVK